LENEHLGNMDQYRVTREVPLPYSLDDIGRDDDRDERSDKNDRVRWLKLPSMSSSSPPEMRI
jgi:hypothetical protein